MFAGNITLTTNIYCIICNAGDPDIVSNLIESYVAGKHTDFSKSIRLIEFPQ